MHQRSGGSSRSQKVDDEIEHLGVQDRWSLEVLARGSGSGKNEYSRPDDRSDTKRSQRPRTERLSEPVFWFLGLSNQFVDRLTTKKLAAHGLGRRFRSLIGAGRWSQKSSFASSISRASSPARAISTAPSPLSSIAKLSSPKLTAESWPLKAFIVSPVRAPSS